MVYKLQLFLKHIKKKEKEKIFNKKKRKKKWLYIKVLILFFIINNIYNKKLLIKKLKRIEVKTKILIQKLFVKIIKKYISIFI